MTLAEDSRGAAEVAGRQLLLDVLDTCGLEDWQRLTIFAAASSYAKLVARRIAAEGEQ